MERTHLDANLANWDERARVHAGSKMYDLAGFVADPTRVWLHPSEPVELDVRGKRLVQLQCHLGVETLSWARLGAARVVGLDFSAEAIARATALAAACGLADRARFVCADVHDAAAALADEAPFDVVYVSVGAISWLPSITRWADQVAAIAGPGAVVFLREVHPMLGAVEERDGALVATLPYFEVPTPNRWDDATTYTEGRPAITSATCYDWNHGLGEIVQALLDRGFALERLIEHREAEFQAYPSMTQGEDGLWRLPETTRDRVPLTFTLRARRR